jgi:uncharacterized membrane protein
MVLWLKFIHLSAIAIWSAGLVCLPGLCVARTPTLGGEALYRLQAAVRYTYVVVVSPAAFVAIASGIALIFARQTFEPWFSIKLTFVAALVLVHVLTGLAVIRLFDEDRAFSFPIFLVAISVTLAVIVAILALVLGKPDFEGDFLPVVLGEPGGLRRMVRHFSPWQTP